MVGLRRCRIALGSYLVGLTLVVGVSSLVLAADSGGYRGPGRNGVFLESGLMKTWPAGGPALVWRLGNLGHAWGSIHVARDTVYAVGGGATGKLFAFSLDGETLWQTKYGREFAVRYVGARATPIVSGPYVIIASGVAVVYCLDADSGEILWSVDTAERFDNQVPGWGYNLTPVVVDEKVILPIRRGKCTAAALDIHTGKTVWANKPSEYAIGDSSPVLVEHGKTRLVVNNLWNGLVAMDPDTGEIVWKLEGRDRAGTTLTPVFNEGLLLTDWDRKTVMFQPTPDGKGFKELWRIPRISSTAQAVILDGKVFAFGTTAVERQEASGSSTRRRVTGMLCYDARSGELLQAEASPRKPGSIVAADGMVYWQEDGPRITLTKVTRRGFEITGSFEPDYGDTEMWIHPVIAEGRLFVRSDCAQGGDYAKAAGKLAVYDLRADRAAELAANRKKVESLIEDLKAAGAAKRAQAAEELRAMGHRARPAVHALIENLQDADAVVRTAAAAALGAVGSEAIPGLITALQDDRIWKQGLAAKALVEATPKAEGLTAALVDAAEGEAGVRDEVAVLLRRIGPEAVPALDALLPSDDRHARWWAINVLAEYGAAAEAAVPNLIDVIRTRNQWFRANAARALGSIGPAAREAVAVLVAQLKDEYADARVAAAEALGRIGQNDRPVIDALRAASKDADPNVAEAAKQALKKLGG